MASQKPKQNTKKQLPTEKGKQAIQNTELIPDVEKMDIVELRGYMHRYFSGPLPDPAMLKEYETALPGAADRIISMAESEKDHRHEMESILVNGEVRDSLKGIYAAVVITILILICGTLIVILNSSIAGIISGSLLNIAGIVMVIKAFLQGTGSRKNKENDSDKD